MAEAHDSSDSTSMLRRLGIAGVFAALALLLAAVGIGLAQAVMRRLKD